MATVGEKLAVAKTLKADYPWARLYAQDVGRLLRDREQVLRHIKGSKSIGELERIMKAEKLMT